MTATRRLNAIDRAFLALDSDEVSAHVACLAVFHLPEGAPRHYLRDLVARLHQATTFTAPFNFRLATGLRHALAPVWDVLPDEQIDLGYHVQHSALPKPGGEVELGRLVSRLHSRPLDPTKPLWEFHVIEGLADRRWAIYVKVHHALMDGVAGSRRLARMVGPDPGDMSVRPLWAVDLPSSSARTESGPAPQPPRETVGRVRQAALVGGQLTRATGQMVSHARHPDDPALAVPFTAPPTPRLNGRVTRQRRVAVQSFDLQRIRAIAHAARVTINDVFITIVAGALRRYLGDLGELPDTGLIAGAPVSVRLENDDSSANAIAFVMVNTFTDIDDPRQRLAAVNRSSTIAKAQLKSLHPAAAGQYGLLTNGPYIVQNMIGLGGRMRPPYNLVVSNVPGPVSPQYLCGSPLYALYPISAVLHGQALNITAMTLGGRFNVGCVGDRDRLPSLQRLATHTGDVLAELEVTLGLATPDS